MEIIDKYPDKPWSWGVYGISTHPNITIEQIFKLKEKYPDKPWDWYYISQNPNITMEIINKYPDKPWSWERISRISNITMEDIENNDKEMGKIIRAIGKNTYLSNEVKEQYK